MSAVTTTTVCIRMVTGVITALADAVGILSWSHLLPLPLLSAVLESRANKIVGC